jgi:hypothetical protein
MENKRIKNGIKIINYAIVNKISVGKASVKCGFSPTYVKNVKSDLKDELNRNCISGDNVEYCKEFFNLHEKYKAAYLTKPQQTKLKTHIKDEENNKNLQFNVEGDIKQIKTIDELLTHCSVDLNKWALDKYEISKWDVTSWKNENIPETIQNFRVKGVLKRKEEEIRSKLALEAFIQGIKNYTPPIFELKDVENFDKSHSVENNLLEISIFDLHLGKLGWAGETGENYDSKIASERFINSIKELLFRASAHSFNKILFPIGSDFFNSDNLYNTTTAGTPQDEDLRWQKTFDIGVKLIKDAIYLLKQTGKVVDVLLIPGNHDYERSFYLGAAIECCFENDGMVNIIRNASPRKYYNFGKVLLGFTHGSEEKEASLPMLMATEEASREYWANSKFREWHIGHIHRKRKVDYTILEKNRVLTEDLGVTVRYLSSLTGTEEWHHRKGFVSQIKAAEAFIWNDERGLIVNLNTNIIIDNDRNH